MSKSNISQCPNIFVIYCISFAVAVTVTASSDAVATATQTVVCNSDRLEDLLLAERI